MTAKVDGEEQELSASTDSPFAAYVFKTISDPYTGRISLMRVFSGGARVRRQRRQPRQTRHPSASVRCR